MTRKIDVYVGVEDAVSEGVVTTSLFDDSVRLDWVREGSFVKRLVGVEVLGARSVDIDGVIADNTAEITRLRAIESRARDIVDHEDSARADCARYILGV